MGGDTLCWSDGTFFVNGAPLTGWTHYPREHPDRSLVLLFGKYQFDPDEHTTLENIVPGGLLFLVGDNPTASYDSRRFGFVSVESVVGIVNP